MASPAHATMFAAGMLYTLICFYAIILPSILILCANGMIGCYLSNSEKQSCVRFSIASR